jgi:hypothetical protein
MNERAIDITKLIKLDENITCKKDFDNYCKINRIKLFGDSRKILLEIVYIREKLKLPIDDIKILLAKCYMSVGQIKKFKFAYQFFDIIKKNLWIYNNPKFKKLVKTISKKLNNFKLSNNKYEKLLYHIFKELIKN